MRKLNQAKHSKNRWLRIREIVGMILIIFGISWLFFETKDFIKNNSLFQIENFSFEHNILFDHPEVQKILDSNFNLNIFGFNLLSLKKKLEKIPQVKNVTVQRKFPNIIQIKIEERKPFLLLNRGDFFYGVDSQGYIFPLLKGRFRWDLPVITGLNDQDFEISINKQKVLPKIALALKINYCFKKNSFNLPQVSEIHIGKFDECLIYTFNPRLALRLTNGNFERSIENLNLIIADLGDRIFSTDYIDLRFQEKAFVHLKG